MNNQQTCSACKKHMSNFKCGICQDPICKKCTQFLEETFNFSRKIPEELTHNAYCENCYNEKVLSAIYDYNQIMDKAKEVQIYSKSQSKETSLFKRKTLPYKVEDCDDETEALMKMSFYAIEDKFNCLIDVELTKKKIIHGSYKKFTWSASAVPFHLEKPNREGFIGEF